MTIAECFKEAVRRSGIPESTIARYFQEPPMAAEREVPADLAAPFIKYATKWCKRLWKTGKPDSMGLLLVINKLLADIAIRRN